MVPVQKLEHFFLKRHVLVMLGLALDVPANSLKLGFANSKSSIARLPSENDSELLPYPTR